MDGNVVAQCGGNSVPETQSLPLVSVFMFCKDRAATIGRSIDSILSQSYPNIEVVIQDGASTDGTLEVLHSYGDRLKIVSEPDSGPAEGFWRALQRCTGEFIGSCASDEEMMPGAVELAVARFLGSPELGAFCGDGYFTDLEGNILSEAIGQPYNIVDYLFGTYCPFWPSSYFRRSALADIGLFDGAEGWTIESLEFEIWCRLGTRHEIGYFPGFLSKYAFHDGQLSNTPRNFYEHIVGRERTIKQLFSEDGFFGPNTALLNMCLYNQFYLFFNHAKALKLENEIAKIGAYLSSVPLEETGQGTVLPPAWAIQRLTGMAGKFSEKRRKQLPLPLKRVVYTAVIKLASLADKVRHRVRFVRQRAADPHYFPEPGSRNAEKMKALYRHVGMLYEARGQINQSYHLLKLAAGNDPMLESVALQALLKAPATTSQQLLALHKDWAERHAKPNPAKLNYKFPRWDGKRPINVAYLCSFYDGSCGRSQITPFVRAHDKGKVRTFGYSYNVCKQDIIDSFDVFRVTGRMTSDQFVDQCRADGIDVVVELTGFSPEHRFSAMASRCAPVQIATFNHTGTTGVPNVDWVLTDEISAPVTLDPYYSEKIYRLKDSFLCTTYANLVHPDPSPLPARENGYVTFGCFGSGGKINEQLIAWWAAILHRVPNSRIFVRNRELDLSANRRLMAERFAQHGIDASRLDIRSGADRDTVLRNYGDVDISLDTWPYCGGNTVCESLWQGVPVVTLLGERFTSRYGAGILAACGCGELVADTAEAYVDVAARLADDLPKLEHYRFNLRQMMFDHGFSNTHAYAAKLEEAYADMLRQAQGESPARGQDVSS